MVVVAAWKLWHVAMTMRFRLIPLLMLVACGSSENNGNSGTPLGGSPDGSTPSGPGTLPDGGSLPSVTCDGEPVTDIAGTWNVIGSRPGDDQATAVLQIDRNSFSFAAAGKSLSFAVSGSTMTLLWRANGKEVPIGVTHDDSVIDTGLLPLSVGGKWNFTSTTDGQSCNYSMGANGLSATCNNVTSTPFGRLNGTVVGQRQSQLPSVFGELGGTWHLTGDGKGSVDVTVSGNTFSAVTKDTGGPLGHSDSWVNVSVCKQTASGKTSNGFEFAATRQ